MAAGSAIFDVHLRNLILARMSISPRVSPTKPPAAVKQAIADFRAVGGFLLAPRKESERSFIYDWGVRVVHESGCAAWLCLASEECRQKKDNLFVMSHQRTSSPANHLRTVHNIWSVKTLSEQQKKRKRDDEIEEIEKSQDDVKRINMLTETQRIVNNNLPFNFGESRESLIVNRLTKKEAVKNDTVNAKQVQHMIVELYSSTKLEILDALSRRLRSHPCLTVMVDFWTCTVTHSKFFGLRVILVDDEFEIKSFLLGVREFKPTFGDRENSYRKCVVAYMESILHDFKLEFNDIYAGASDSGSDVKALLTTELNYVWEWCMAHMAHAATRAACGLSFTGESSPNPEMEALIRRMNATISHVKAVETAGDLFDTLCEVHSTGKATQLLDYVEARFLSLATALERLLSLWDVLVSWYEARVEQAKRKKTCPPRFHLMNDKQSLIQLYSLIKPLAALNRRCKSPSELQVDVLLDLYLLRLNTLREGVDIEDYRSTEENQILIHFSEMTPIAVKTQRLLQDAFDQRFFRRYTDDTVTDKCSFLFELQQKLHPNFKSSERSLIQVVRVCCVKKGMNVRQAQERAREIDKRIEIKLRDLMIANAGPIERSGVNQEIPPTMDRRLLAFGPTERSQARRRNELEIKVDEDFSELKSWLRDMQMLRQDETGTVETVLQFWKRRSAAGEYTILSKLARILFAVPASTAQIERDFSVCGKILTRQRASMKPSNLDMCAFVNINREYTDLAQCTRIPEDEIDKYRPSSKVVLLNPHPAPEYFTEDLAAWEVVNDVFSNTSIDDN